MFFTDCKMPLGLESGAILDGQITASSEHHPTDSNCCYARFGRLNHGTRWHARLDDNNKWIKVDLIHQYMVTGIVVQGAASYVKTCKVKYEEVEGTGALVYVKDTDEKVKVAFQARFSKRNWLKCSVVFRKFCQGWCWKLHRSVEAYPRIQGLTVGQGVILPGGSVDRALWSRSIISY